MTRCCWSCEGIFDDTQLYEYHGRFLCMDCYLAVHQISGQEERCYCSMHPERLDVSGNGDPLTGQGGMCLDCLENMLEDMERIELLRTDSILRDGVPEDDLIRYKRQ